jgi:hypothetical protein
MAKPFVCAVVFLLRRLFLMASESLFSFSPFDISSNASTSSPDHFLDSYPMPDSSNAPHFKGERVPDLYIS